MLFAFTSINLFALEISVQGAKENFQNYSVLHITDQESFVCQSIKDDFEVITQIVCAFNHKPSSEIKKIQNDFFEIDTKVKSGTFFLLITPVHKIKLFPMPFDLRVDENIFEADVKLANHWMVIGYKKELPYLKEEIPSEVAINFPFFMNKDKLPYVGGLDIKGNPVHLKRVQDVSDYIQIKQLYADKKYDESLELVKLVTEEYPNSLFKSELLFYEIRNYAQLGDFDNVISASKEFLREYSSDENVPEVLSLTAKGYSMIGLSTDADYFFDRLFNEHADSPYSKWGYIYKAEMLESSGGSSKAINYYTMALEETDDINIAAYAAFRLAGYFLVQSQKVLAAGYVNKILNAKNSFFFEHLKESLEMMYTFIDEQDFITAAAIDKSILDYMPPNHDEYEKLYKDRGIWLSQTENKKEALEALNDYLTTFKDGDYIDSVQVAKDSLFFNATDKNLTAKLDDYNSLIQQYKNDTIGQRAVYEKAKLELENKMYSDILTDKQTILSLDNTIYTDTNSIVNEAALGIMKVSLENKECNEVLNISNEYNMTLSAEWDERLYDCAMKGGDFLLSKNIASKNLTTSNIEKRKEWLYRYIKVDFSTGNYSDAIGASKDLITLIQEEKNSKYKDVYRILFDSYQRLEDEVNMTESIALIEKEYGKNYKDVDRYVAMMAIGNTNKDDKMVIKYGSIVYNMQKNSDSHAQSPFVEFTLFQTYVNTENYNMALEVIASLDKVELNNNQRARQKYLLGTVYEKLWRDDEAKKAYQESIDADPASAWANLAKDAKGI